MSSRMQRWLVVGLVVSLILNALFVGLWAGRELAKPTRPLVGTPAIGVMRWVRTLPEARLAELTPQVHAYRKAARPNVRQMRQAQRNFQAAMRAEAIDEDEMREALNDLHSGLQQSRRASHEALVELLSQLTADERAELDEFLRQPRRHGRSPRVKSAGGL